MDYVVVGWALVCVCVSDSLLPEEIVWTGSFVCRCHCSDAHSAERDGPSPAEPSTWPLWRRWCSNIWADPPRSKQALRLCCRTNLPIWNHDIIRGLQNNCRNFTGISLSKKNTKPDCLDYVDYSAALLGVCQLTQCHKHFSDASFLKASKLDWKLLISQLHRNMNSR